MEAYGIDPTHGVGAVQSGRHGTLPGGGRILGADYLRLAMNHIMERDTDSIDIGHDALPATPFGHEYFYVGRSLKTVTLHTHCSFRRVELVSARTIWHSGHPSQ